MPKFTVIQGTHRDEDGREYNAGDVVTAEYPLDEMFPNKFRKGGAKRAAPEEDEDDSTPEEERGTTRSAKTKGSVESVKRGDQEADPDPMEKPAREKVTRAQAANDDEDEAPAKKKGAKKKSSKDEADLEEDRTKSFKTAVDNDFSVGWTPGTGYTVKDGDKTLNKTPLKTKAKVEAFLTKHLGGGDTDGSSGKNDA